MSEDPWLSYRRRFDFISDREQRMAWAQELGYGFVDLDRIPLDRIPFACLPGDLVRLHRVIPVEQEKKNLWLAMENPQDLAAIDAVKDFTGCRVVPVLSMPGAIDPWIERHYPAAPLAHHPFP